VRAVVRTRAAKAHNLLTLQSLGKTPRTSDVKPALRVTCVNHIRKKQPLLQTPIRHALLAAPDSGYASGQTRRAKRPVVLDSEDEGTFKVTLLSVYSYSRIVDSLPDRAKRSAGSKHEQTSRIMTFEDLGIDLNIWGLAEGIASNTGYTKRQSPIKSPSREAPYYIPAAIKPRRKLPSLHNQHNYSNVDGQTYAQITAVRPPAAMRQTGQVKARANTYYHRLAYGFPYKQYDKRLDSNYHPIRDRDHDIHRNCDVPLPSVEDAYAGTERTKSCKSQR
jgi:hypothetical protein